MKKSASFSLRGVAPPPVARSLFSAMFPLHQLSRALGLTAFCVDPLPSSGRSLRTSRRALAYAGFVTALLVLSAALFFVGMVLVQYPEFAAKSVLANAFTKALHFGTAVAAVGQLSGLKRRHVAAALRRVAMADRVLLAGDASRVYQITYALLNAQVSLYFVVLTMYLAWDAYVVYQSDAMGAVDWLIYAVGQIPHAFNIALTLQFVNLVVLLLHRFRRINAQLDSLLLRYRVARDSRFWRTLQEELRKCGLGEPAGEFPAAGTATRMRFRKRRAPDAAARHLRCSRSEPLRLHGDVVLEASSPFSSLPDSNFSEMDSEYESDERCECVYDAGFRRSWRSASNRTSATSMGSDDGVCDVGGNVTDSVTHGTGDSGSSDMSSEDADTEGDSGDDVEKAIGTGATGSERASLSPHAADPKEDISRRQASRGDVDNDAAHYEARGSRRAEPLGREEEHRLQGSSASRQDIDFPAATDEQSDAVTQENREPGGAKKCTQDGLIGEKESAGRRGSESLGRFPSRDAPLGGTTVIHEELMESIEKSSELEEFHGKNKLDRHSQPQLEQRETVNQQTSEKSLEEQTEGKVSEALQTSNSPVGNTNLESFPTTDRTEYFGMKRPGSEEGFGVREVVSSSSEEGVGTQRKGSEEERGYAARTSCASARYVDDETEETGEFPPERKQGEHPREYERRIGVSQLQGIGNVTLKDHGKLIIKISNGSDTKIAGNCKREGSSSIDQLTMEKDDSGIFSSQRTPSADAVDTEVKMGWINERNNKIDEFDKVNALSEEENQTREKENADVNVTKKCERKGERINANDECTMRNSAGGKDAAEMHPSSIQQSTACVRIRRACAEKRNCSRVSSFCSTNTAVYFSGPSPTKKATDPTRTTIITTTTTATTTTYSNITNSCEPTTCTQVITSSSRISPRSNYIRRGVSDPQNKFLPLIMEPYIATITFNKHLSNVRDNSTSSRSLPRNLSSFKPLTHSGTVSKESLCSEMPPPVISYFPVSPSVNSNLISTAFHKSDRDSLMHTNVNLLPILPNTCNSSPQLSTPLSYLSSLQHGVSMKSSTSRNVTTRYVGTTSLPRVNISNRQIIGGYLSPGSSFTPAVKFATPTDSAVKEHWFDETDSEACSGNCDGATRLRDLRYCHDALSEAARRLASAFGLPLLLLLAYVFTVTVSCVYHSFISGVQFYAFWLAVNILQAVAVTTVCHQCVNAAWRALTLASRALLERPPASVRAELARLRRQVALGPLRFSACGLFAIDVGVLLGMAGGIASYTVIILQFECAH